jgi:hypothetical protein
LPVTNLHSSSRNAFKPIQISEFGGNADCIYLGSRLASHTGVHSRYNFVYVVYHSALKTVHDVAKEIPMFSSAFQLDTDSIVALGWVGVCI